MFQFSANQRHALQHGLQDFGKLTLAVLFLGGATGIIPVANIHPTSHHAVAHHTLTPVKALEAGSFQRKIPPL